MMWHAHLSHNAPAQDLEAQAETEQQKLALMTVNELKHDRFLRENVDHKELKLLRTQALTDAE